MVIFNDSLSFSKHLNVECPLEQVRVHLYLVLATVLGHLDSLSQELDPDVVGFYKKFIRILPQPWRDENSVQFGGFVLVSYQFHSRLLRKKYSLCFDPGYVSKIVQKKLRGGGGMTDLCEGKE